MNSYEMEKERLKQQAQQHLAVLENSFKGVGKTVSTKAPKTLAIGGALFLLYIAGKKVFKKKKPKAFNDPSLNQLVVKTPKKESFIARKIKEQISVFLLAMVKERLAAYIREPSKKNEPLQSTQRKKG